MPRRNWSVADAVALRAQGLTYAEIASRLGVSGESTIREALRRAHAVPRDTSRTRAAVRASTMRWSRDTDSALDRILNNRRTGLRTFGVEIEFHTAIRSDVVQAVQAIVGYHIHMVGYHGNQCVTCGAYVNGYTQWKLETDSSATAGMMNSGSQPYNQGGELVSPVFNDERGLREIALVMEALRRVGAKVDRRHGLHVHIGAQDLAGGTLINLLSNYKHLQPTLYDLVAKSRKNNTYCKFVAVGEIEANIDSISSGRGIRYRDKYRGMNLAPLSRIGTIEMRMHQGSLNGKKATEWIKLLLAFFNASAEGYDASSLDALYSNGFITREHFNWLNGRISTLTRQAVNA